MSSTPASPEPAGASETPEAEWLRRWIGPAALPSPEADELSDPAAAFLAYRDFGLYVWNRGRYRLTLRCGSVGQNGNGGHAHSDQLAITLDVDGQAVIIDPGTGVYTPDPDMRNRFRSAASHSGLLVMGSEPSEWLAGRWGLFALKDCSHARMLQADSCQAEADHFGYGKLIRKIVRLDDGRIELRHFFPDGTIRVEALTQLVFSSAMSIQSEGLGVQIMDSDGRLVINVRIADIGRFERILTPMSAFYGHVAETWAVRCPSESSVIITFA